MTTVGFLQCEHQCELQCELQCERRVGFLRLLSLSLLVATLHSFCIATSLHIDVSKLVPSKPWNLTLFPLRTMSIRKGFEESRGIITRVHSKRFNLIRFQSGKARRERVRRDARQDGHDVGKILPQVGMQVCAGFCRPMHNVLFVQ